MTKTPKNDIERCIDYLSQAPALFPPGLQRQAEISQEIGVPPLVLRQVISQLAVGLLKFSDVPNNVGASTTTTTKKKNDL